MRVGLFPLPNVVLFPRAILPLHIFEERYKMMTEHALRGDRRIAMALLRAGWQCNYYGVAEIEPVVCIGSILNEERLPDGRYNLILEGLARARIGGEERVLCEQTGVSYRVGRLELLEESPALEIDLEEERRRLIELFDRPAYEAQPCGRQFRRLLRGPMPTRDLADLLAFNYIDCTRIKQSLLAETDVKARVQRLVDELAAVAPPWQNVPEDVRVN